MNPECWRQMDQLLKEAFKRSPEERASFLRVACDQDDALSSLNPDGGFKLTWPLTPHPSMRVFDI
jgi:hypothetical protein